jgi:hypothetical protein
VVANREFSVGGDDGGSAHLCRRPAGIRDPTAVDRMARINVLFRNIELHACMSSVTLATEQTPLVLRSN